MSAELVSLVNTAESVSAAVQNGADSVITCLSFGSAPGLSPTEFSGAAEFCRVRGARIYAGLVNSVSDSELPTAVATLSEAWLNGADGIVLNDLGLVMALRRALPDAPIHLSGGLGISTLDGLRAAKAMGASRVILPKGLAVDAAKGLSPASPLELALTVHGFMCPCEGKSCIFSTFSGGGSNLRSLCSRECLKAYSTGTKNQHPFTMKDLCLAPKINELTSAGIAAFIVDGLFKRPEYVAMATSIYSSALKLGKTPTEDELSILDDIEESGGMTLGLTDGSEAMFSPFKTSSDENRSLLATIRQSYLRREFQRVPVYFVADITLSGPLRLAVSDDRGNIAVGEAGKSELAFHRELTQTSLQTELYNTGGTPFYCESVRCRIPKGLTIKSQIISGLRDRLLSELMEKRKTLGLRSTGTYVPPKKRANSGEIPVLTISVQKVSQLSPRILELAPPYIYIPLEEVLTGGERLSPFIAADGIEICATLPEIKAESEKAALMSKLLTLRQLGISHVEVSSPWHVPFFKRLGFKVHGGLGLGVVSSSGLSAMGAFGFESVLLSPELTSLEATELTKLVPSELIVYGRLPLMETPHCLIKGITGVCSCESFSGISDIDGLSMPVLKSHDCGNTVYSSRKIYLINRSQEYMSMGLWGARLCFTTENVRECAAVVERFLGMGDFEPSSHMYGKF